MKTADKILLKALEMFNERGVEYVGLRELAGLLDMRVSNITYYFPTKDDLVYQLSVELNQLNSKVLVADEHITITTFIEMLRTVFYNHLKFRCLLLSFVHLMEQNKKISTRYNQTQKDRNATLRANIRFIISSGFLKIEDDKEVDYLVSAIALVVRFWISEAQISFRHLSPDEQINHYLSLIARMLLPYTTAQYKAELQACLNQLDEVANPNI
ncbi:TetR/AcrR family transcriptional regulator [Rhodocytophaga rosea]|uniref:TetR/AcrR family transcriptional regulator n=1 Tax=Rhodocytophaga rosea TaxID=2704465 RepID=A0A6C0GUW7_9BACT|nr:TetR/AcrR family transcriptional regulator [Rhodocytophaga rosea]QHT71132.1 TetR/AcrR family transcriptional regulator [Rhodocytophaga rosea]